jgi:SAM-dependent methyltransferase
MNMDSRDTYKKFARFYDTYVQGFADDIPLYLSFGTNAVNILEVGCGTGRVLKPLLEQGYSATGVDISDEMLEIAQNRLESYMQIGQLELLNHNLVNKALPVQFDCVFVTFYTFNYILSDREQADFLKNVLDSLKPGGKLLIDLFYPWVMACPENDDKWQAEKHYCIDGVDICLKDKRKMTGNVEERLQVFSDGRNIDEIRTLRRFINKQDMFILLNNAGYKNIIFTDGYNMEAFHPVGGSETVRSSFVAAAGKA